jgi:GNAT superfamily N-acetyltransferase
MPEFTVDAAGPDDVATVVELVAGLFQEDGGRHDPTMNVDWPASDEAKQYYAGLVHDPDAILIVARGGGRLHGYLVGKLREPDSFRTMRLAVLESMRVTPEARGGGVGGLLIDAFAVWARGHGAERAFVTAYAGNEAAQRFYARHGFGRHSVTLWAEL